MTQTVQRWMTYDEASAWCQSQGITTQTELRERKTRPGWPKKLPRAPDQAYKEEWKNGGLGRFLGTGNVATQDIRKGFVTLEEAVAWIRAQGITGSEHWNEKVQEPGWRPSWIPANLSDSYGAEAFNAMGGWPGIVGTNDDPHRSPIERSIQYVLSDVFQEDHLDGQCEVEGQSGKTWKVDCVVEALHLVVEYDGEKYHRDREVNDRLKTEDLVAKGWRVIRIRGGKLPLIQEHWDLAVNEKSSHHRRIDQLLSHLKSLHESQHLNTPGWAMTAIDKWLTEDLQATNFREVLGQWKGKVSMEEAMEWARTHHITTQDEWFKKHAELGKPRHIPSNPAEFYGEQFPGLGVFLGTGRVANQDREFCSLKEAIDWIRAQQVKSKDDWEKRCSPSNRGWRPHWIPYDLAAAYGDSWPGWPVALGKVEAPEGWVADTQPPRQRKSKRRAKRGQ